MTAYSALYATIAIYRRAVNPAVEECGARALDGVVVLSVQNLAVASRRAACSKALQFGDFRAISDGASH